MKFNRKPKIINAIQWTGRNHTDIWNWGKDRLAYLTRVGGNQLKITTLQQEVVADPNDYIIMDDNKGFYLCKPDIFEETYDPIKSKAQFATGDTVVWNPKNFNSAYWNNLSEKDRVRFYGALGYGRTKPKYFTFLCHHNRTPGHCTLVSMDDQKIETMRHTEEFDLVNEDDL